MAPSFDCYGVSSLFCAEDNSSIFDEVDNNSNNNNININNDNYDGVVVDDDFEICNWQQHQQPSFVNQEHNFISGEEAFFSGFFVPNDECLTSMFDKERQYFLGFDYLKRLRCGDLDLGARNQAIDWIEKVQSHYNFGPLCVYLSVNYLDRFLAAYELPKDEAWMMQLLAVSCLSIAAKMDETDVPLSLDLQVGETKFIFEARTIQRMELLVLSTLKWRMQSLTPFSFIDYFLYKLSGEKMPAKSLVFQAIQLILSTIRGIDLMEFRYSEIAAAVAISVTQETQTVELTDKALSFLYDHVEKEKLMKCVEIIHDLRMNSSRSSGLATTSVPQSPIGVLDAACLSYKSDETTPSGSCANSAHTSPAPKRRKLDRTLASS